MDGWMNWTKWTKWTVRGWFILASAPGAAGASAPGPAPGAPREAGEARAQRLGRGLRLRPAAGGTGLGGQDAGLMWTDDSKELGAWSWCP